ncbi:MAG TPA: hypothetical protein VFR71_08540 [Methyloceanibacter sp.]|nr:hypothetical protein [Methyloceanibacter sp.]
MQQALVLARRPGMTVHLRGDVLDLEGDVVDAPDLNHGVDALLDEAERFHHLLGTLPGDVLKRARGVDVGGALVDLVAKRDISALLAQGPGDLISSAASRTSEVAFSVASTMLSSSSEALKSCSSIDAAA